MFEYIDFFEKTWLKLTLFPEHILGLNLGTLTQRYTSVKFKS